MPTPAGHLQRSLAHLAFGAIRDVERKREAVSGEALAEVFQNFQIPLSGAVDQGMTWVKKKIDFDVHFHGATGQRDNPYDHPQYTGGFVLSPADDKAAVPAIIVQTMVEWLDDESQTTTGCWLHVGVHSPAADKQSFDGEIHLSFHGFGATNANMDGGD